MKVVGYFINLFLALHETLTDVCTQVTFLMDFLELLILRNEILGQREENVFTGFPLTPVYHWISFHMGHEFPPTSEGLSDFLGSL